MAKQELGLKKSQKRGIILLPNLFTVGALFAGFYAIVAAMRGNYADAAIAIFVGMILDSLDGRIARLTNTQTAFGAELDSLSDMVSFGIAPALVVYSWALHNLGKVGWLFAFAYATATALRLARFNTQLASADKRYFQGLPCPAAAGVVAGMVWSCALISWEGWSLWIVATVITVGVAIAMVSNIRYRSFKDLDLRGRVPFLVILIIVLVFVLVAIQPPFVLFVAFFGYSLSGIFGTLWLRQRKRRIKRKKNKLRAV